MYKGIYLLLIVICLAGCHRKAKPDLDNPDEPEVCVDLSKYITMSAQFSRDLAKFDPVYPEILYYIKTSYKTIDLDLHRTSNRIMQLFSYNLRTNSFSLILYSRGGQIDTLTGGRQVDFGFKTFTPGPNEWILFQDNSRNIWKVKKDGTAMRKIREKASGPSWNKDGTQILFYDQTTQKNTIMDLDGSTKSVLNIGTSNLSFTGVNGVLVGLNGGSSQIFQYNADYQSKTNTSTADPRSEFSDIGLLPNGYEAIVCQPDWIIKWNLTDSTIKEYLRPNCNSRSYEMPNVSPDGNRVVFTKKCRDKLDAQYLIDKHDIYIMDIRCWRAKKLELP